MLKDRYVFQKIEDWLIKDKIIRQYYVLQKSELKTLKSKKINKETRTEIEKLINWKYQHIITEIINK